MSDERKQAFGVLAPVSYAAQEKGSVKPGGAQMAAGYANHGASTSKNAFLGWVIGGGAPEDDIDLQAGTLRQRARDLDMGGGIPRSAVATETTTVIGEGLIPKPSIDYEALGMSEEAALEWQKITKREFAFWAEGKMCDSAHRKNFYQLQSLAFRSFLVSGDVIALLPMFPAPGTPYTLHVQLLEADRLATPESNGESTSQESGKGRIIDGVEIDEIGRVVKYHIASRHPLNESATGSITYQPIDAYGKDTGMPNVLHVYVPERPEQYRGVPLVAPIIEKSKQLDRYLNSELAANVVSSMFTLFITSQPETDITRSSLTDAVPESEQAAGADGNHLHMKAGAVIELEPGQEPKPINPMRPNSAFAAFVDAVSTQLGASIEMPKEILLKAFTKSYSASRAALTEYWRKVPVARRNFVADFCQPVYEAWLAEAVAIGRIEAPGFFDDPVTRRAWCKCEWIGSTMQQLDPLKEVEAAERRVALNISTQEREAAEFNGSDWNENIAQRQREITAIAGMSAPGKISDPHAPGDGDEDDEEGTEENDDA